MNSINKKHLYLFMMTTAMIVLAGCNPKKNIKNPYDNFAVVTSSEMASDLKSVADAEESLNSEGFTFKLDEASKMYSWEKEFRSFHFKVENPKTTDTLNALKNLEATLIAVLNKYSKGYFLKQEDGNKKLMSLEKDVKADLESKLKLTQETIASLQALPQEETTDTPADTNQPSSTADSKEESSQSDSNNIPLPQKKPIL